MLTTNTGRFSLVLALTAALLASPELAEAQGKGKGKEKEKERARPELVRRDSRGQAAARAQEKQLRQTTRAQRERQEDRELRLRDDRDYREYGDYRDGYDPYYDGRQRRDGYDPYYDGRQRRDVPPGWCIGKGNPHNTPENCGPGARRNDRYDRDVVYDRDGRYGRTGDWGRYGSYEQAHEEFHRWHDRECRMRAAERPLDLQWQLRVRAECKQRHDDWHYRAGQRHDG